MGSGHGCSASDSVAVLAGESLKDLGVPEEGKSAVEDDVCNGLGSEARGVA